MDWVATVPRSSKKACNMHKPILSLHAEEAGRKAAAQVVTASRGAGGSRDPQRRPNFVPAAAPSLARVESPQEVAPPSFNAAAYASCTSSRVPSTCQALPPSCRPASQAFFADEVAISPHCLTLAFLTSCAAHSHALPTPWAAPWSIALEPSAVLGDVSSETRLTRAERPSSCR
jgi:hypothetical protein